VIETPAYALVKLDSVETRVKRVSIFVGFRRASPHFGSGPAVLCPNGCSSHGKCMSLREAAPAYDGRNLVYDNVYDSPWDADMIFGCVCDPTFTGYDCSQRLVVSLFWSVCVWRIDSLRVPAACA
jgi:hypothetical protein